jgi:chromosome segregation ATPase
MLTKAANQSTSGEKEMTYEQMEKTMQFILDQQAASTAKQSEFEEWRKQLAAENAERDRRFAAENAERDRKFDEQLKQVVATFAEQNGKIYEMMMNTHNDLGTLSADALFFRDTGEDHEKRINELNDAMSALTRQMTSLGAKVEDLAETVRNLIKGGSNGWPRN